MVSEARRIISYFSLGKKNQPPPSIWHSPWKCTKWIEESMSDKGRSDDTFDLNESEIA